MVVPLGTAVIVGASGALERRRGALHGRTVGILGMAFKAESDDPHASLSYELRKWLAWAGARVLATDPYRGRSAPGSARGRPRGEMILIIGAPHRAYRELELGDREVVDVRNALGRGIRI